MNTVKKLEIPLNATGLRFAVVASRFNSFIVDHLESGAVDTLTRHGARRSDILVVHVPGSFEIPLACRKLAQSGRVDAIVAVGAVIRGATTHYELVCNEVARGVSAVMNECGIPVGFGVITTDNIEQAIERSGSKAGNKGAEAAAAAIEMASLIRTIDKGEL